MPIAEPPLIGVAGDGSALLFITGTGTPEIARVMRFGPSSAGSEAAQCGHASATPPRVESGSSKELTRVNLGEEVTLATEVIGANSESVEWKLKNATSGKEETASSSEYEFQMPTLKHTFAETGVYEITDKIVPDDFGPAIEGHSKLVVGEPPIELGAIHVRAVTAGQAEMLSATVTDPREEPASLSYVWQYGDGAKSEGKVEAKGPTELKAEHTYANAGSYTATLTVTDAKGSAKATQTVTVSSAGGGGSNNNNNGSTNSGGSGGSTGGSTGSSNSGPGTGVQGFQAGPPAAMLASTSLGVSSNGTFDVKVTCPANATSCAGTITLRTLTAVSAGAHKRKAVLTLASASFSLAGGQAKVVALHLSAAARALLARAHVLRAKTTLLAHDSAGTTHTTQVVVTLRPVKAGKRHKH